MLELDPSDALCVGMLLAMSVFLILCEAKQGHVSAFAPKNQCFYPQNVWRVVLS